MKRILIALALMLGLFSPAHADDLLQTLFGSAIGSPPIVAGPQRLVYGGVRRGYGFFRRHVYAPAAGIANMVTEVANENGVSPALAHAVVRIESGYNCHAHNGAAAGIMQTNWRTARSMGVSGNLSDCRTGLVAGMRYLRSAIAMHGWGCAAFSAYQSGLGVHRCSTYGRRVMALMSGGSDTGASAHFGSHRHRLWRYAGYHRHHGERFAGYHRHNGERFAGYHSHHMRYAMR